MQPSANTELVFDKYSVKWDGSQWVVKRKAPLAKNEILVGYYAYLPSAIWFGVLHQESAIQGKARVEAVVKRMEALWDDIRATYPRHPEAGPSPA